MVGEGQSHQIYSPGFNPAYSAALVLLFQIPAKIKAQRRKLSLWASTRPQLLCVHNKHNCTRRKGTVPCPSASHGWPRSAAQTTSLNILLQRTPCCWRQLPSDRVLCKSICNKRPNSCTFCRYIYCTSAALPLRCSWDGQACRQNKAAGSKLGITRREKHLSHPSKLKPKWAYSPLPALKKTAFVLFYKLILPSDCFLVEMCKYPIFRTLLNSNLKGILQTERRTSTSPFPQEWHTNISMSSRNLQSSQKMLLPP